MAETTATARLVSTLMDINSRLTKIEAAQTAHDQKQDDQCSKLNAIHTAIYVGNGTPGIISRLVALETQLRGMAIRAQVAVMDAVGGTDELRKHNLKIGGKTSVGVAALYLGIKLVVYFVTGTWPAIP